MEKFTKGMNLDNIFQTKIGKDAYLLLNSYTGAIDLVPANFLTSPDPSVVSHLTKRGYFLQKSEIAEAKNKLLKIYKNNAKNAPHWFYILTTLNCNYDCPICYEKSTYKTSNISEATAASVLRFIKKLQQEKQIPNRKMNIILFGGEPLMGDRRVITKIFSEVEQNGWKVVIVTNGSLVIQNMELFERYKYCISDFRITLDGPREIHNKRRPFKAKHGSFDLVVNAIDILLKNNFQVKMQTILGNGNLKYLDQIVGIINKYKWTKYNNFQWRIEGSHDYANLDPEKDEISEGKMVKELINLIKRRPEIKGKIKFESFKYLGHVVESFGWMGDYKAYWGPKIAFCEPQKGFQYVFSTDGSIYHCPRTINNKRYKIGDFEKGFNEKIKNLKQQIVYEKSKCVDCSLNSFCGGGCAVQGVYYKKFDCQKYAEQIFSEFFRLMEKEVLAKTKDNKIVSINKLW